MALQAFPLLQERRKSSFALTRNRKALQNLRMDGQHQTYGPYGHPEGQREGKMRTITITMLIVTVMMI